MMGTGGDMSWRNRFKFKKKCEIVKSNRQSQEKKNGIEKICSQVQVKFRLLTPAELHDGSSIASVILENLKPRGKTIT